MLPFLAAAAVAFGAVFLAEFGDKSQLLILAFSTRYPARQVVIGLVLAAAAVQGISVAIGSAIGALLPQTAVLVVSALAFLAVAAWILRGDQDEPGDERAAARGRVAGLARVLTVASTFIVGATD